MELWDAYYLDGTKAGVDLMRGQPIPPEYRHAVTEILVLHQDGSILLMQRDFCKPFYPGYWEASAGGSVLKGESFLEGAKRELWEETGLQEMVLQELYCDVTADTIYRGFLCITTANKDSILLQPGETIAYRWVNAAEFQELLAKGLCISNVRGQLDAFLRRFATEKTS